MSPPRAPIPRMGAKALVMMPSGRLRSTPRARPIAQRGPGAARIGMSRPIANRLINAPRRAARLSGNDNGIMLATANAPYARPAINPNMSRDIGVSWERVDCLREGLESAPNAKYTATLSGEAGKNQPP